MSVFSAVVNQVPVVLETCSHHVFCKRPVGLNVFELKAVLQAPPLSLSSLTHWEIAPSFGQVEDFSTWHWFADQTLGLMSSSCTPDSDLHVYADFQP